uniref:hypothetical protein n=1 Tax=Ndongobacter massiliensis TaxID=1871025 RepID=UPI000930A6D3|nr:hypothetical protein [Ndongobacter massiliensis]
MKIISRIRDFLYVIVDYAFVLVVGAGLAAICWFSYKNLIGYAEHSVPQDTFEAVSEESNQAALTVKVTIPEATTPEQLSTLLQEYGVLSEARAADFTDYLKEHFSAETIPSGDYYFRADEDFSEILNALNNASAPSTSTEQSTTASDRPQSDAASSAAEESVPENSTSAAN